jgi:hypothetical protein
MIASSHNRESRQGYACLHRNECNNAYGVSGYPEVNFGNGIATSVRAEAGLGVDVTVNMPIKVKW